MCSVCSTNYAACAACTIQRAQSEACAAGTENCAQPWGAEHPKEEHPGAIAQEWDTSPSPCARHTRTRTPPALARPQEVLSRPPEQTRAVQLAFNCKHHEICSERDAEGPCKWLSNLI